jgi:hypothetical protein
MATAFHEWQIGKVVWLGEPAIDIRHHRLKQDAVFDAAHADAVAGQAKRHRQTEGLAAPVLEEFANSGT